MKIKSFLPFLLLFFSLNNAYSFNYTIINFTSVGTINWSVPKGVSEIDILIVAGGGAGGICGNQAGGGGGGAGGFIEILGLILNDSSYNITVGAGGLGTGLMTNGENSSFGNITAQGGGHGGGWTSTSGEIASEKGGSGGGAGYGNVNIKSDSLAIFPEFGNPGGEGISSGGYPGGGGGGAGTSGYNALSGIIAGDGGWGKMSNITGLNYSGGGGAGIWGGTAGIGRNGGGNGSISGAGGHGLANTGGGGGGATKSSLSNPGGNGGSGIIIIRYITPNDNLDETILDYLLILIDNIDNYFNNLNDYLSNQFNIIGEYFNNLNNSNELNESVLNDISLIKKIQICWFKQYEQIEDYYNYCLDYANPFNLTQKQENENIALNLTGYWLNKSIAEQENKGFSAGDCYDLDKYKSLLNLTDYLIINGVMAGGSLMIDNTFCWLKWGYMVIAGAKV